MPVCKPSPASPPRRVNRAKIAAERERAAISAKALRPIRATKAIRTARSTKASSSTGVSRAYEAAKSSVETEPYSQITGSREHCPKRKPEATSQQTKPEIEEQLFSLFPKLPAEIQLKIWSHALPGPRIITIKHQTKYKTFDFYYRRHFGSMVDSPHQDRSMIATTSSLPLLHACHDSRATSLRTYRLAFSEVLHRPLYFDASRDIVWIEDIYVLNQLCTHPMSSLLRHYNVRSLSLQPYSTEICTIDSFNGAYHIYNFLNNLENVKQSLLVAARVFATLSKLTLLHDNFGCKRYGGPATLIPNLKRSLKLISSKETVEDVVSTLDTSTQDVESVIGTTPEVISLIYGYVRKLGIAIDMKAQLLAHAED